MDKQACTNSIDSDQILQNVASDLHLHCLSVIQQFLETLTDCKMDIQISGHYRGIVKEEYLVIIMG